ncbi:transposase [Paenibacillus odorifer]|uniref:transposase n=1 Tax=Paenibacillus odorifer TaxID=189426 RepID=UPI000BA138BD|nr:hypothetical protein CA596_17565 [Paenibacillus odorifer]
MCNRQTRRHLNLPTDLLLIDSTYGHGGKLPSALGPIQKFRGGIKLHGAWTHDQRIPLNVEESIANRHRDVEIENNRGEIVRVVTDVRKASPHVIAKNYKTCWQIEVFFRWIKQHLMCLIYLERQKMRYIVNYLCPLPSMCSRNTFLMKFIPTCLSLLN